MVAAPVFARPASEMRDLVGLRASSAESDLEYRGFTHITTSEYGNYRQQAYWWNSGDKNCVRVVTANGRIANIGDATAGDCRQKSGGNAAAIAVGVAALAGLAAILATRHKDRDTPNDASYSRVYDLGYDDGLRGRRFDQSQPDPYRPGYIAGERYRGVPHRDHSRAYIGGIPRNAQDACKRRADTFFEAVPGVSKPVSGYREGYSGSYRIVTSTHKALADCGVSDRGYVDYFRRRG
jgi:hypothetical protein